MGEARMLIDQALAMARRRRWLALGVFLVVFAAGVTAARSLPSLYRSTALVAIDEQQVPEDYVKNTVTGQLEARLLRMSEALLSRSRVEDLLARFALYPELRNLETTSELTGRLRGDIELEIRGVQSKVRGTPLTALSITYRGSDPNTVAAVVNALASAYVEENTRLRERQALGTAEFLKSHLRAAAERLGEQEQKVSAFKRHYLGELPEQSQANLTTLEHLHNQLRTTTDAQNRARERIEQRAQTDALASSLRALTGDSAAATGETVAARVNRLKQELIELRLRFSEKYPDVIHKRAEVAALEQLMGSGDASVADGGSSRPGVVGDATAASPAARREEEELKLLKEEENLLRRAIAMYQARIENTPKREQEFLELSRDYDTTKQLYATLLKRYDEAQIAGNLEHRQKGEQFRILEAAKPGPASPRRVRITALVLAAALALAAVAVFGAEKLDASFHTPGDVRSFTPVPLLAAIPVIVVERDTFRRRVQLALGTAATAIVLVLMVGLAHYVATGNERLVLALMRFGI